METAACGAFMRFQHIHWKKILSVLCVLSGEYILKNILSDLGVLCGERYYKDYK